MPIEAILAKIVYMRVCADAIRRCRNIAAVAIAALILVLYSLPASAQVRCAPRQSLIQYFFANYEEAPSAHGLIAAHLVIELLTSESGSWTILITRPNGVSCIVGKGEAWEQALTEMPPAEQVVPPQSSLDLSPDLIL